MGQLMVTTVVKEFSKSFCGLTIPKALVRKLLENLTVWWILIKRKIILTLLFLFRYSRLCICKNK